MGVVFDTDVVRAVCATERSPTLLTRKWSPCAREAPLSEAVAVMAEQHLTHLVVVDAPLEPVGILSTFDVMGVLGSAR